MVKPRPDSCWSRIRQGGAARRLAPLCALSILGACHAAEESSGGVEISASTKALRYSDIAEVSATISGPEIPKPLIVPLGAREDNVWKASVTGIPVGPGRVVSVIASDQAGVGLFFGEATNVTIKPGATTPISIVLFEMSPAPAFVNQAPTIDALTASAVAVAPGATATLGVQAHDPDAVDVIAYAWSASCGSLVGEATAAPVWTAPDGIGICHVAITVSDDRGASVSSSLTLVVDGTLRGGAAVSVSPDLSPVIRSISLVPTPLVVGEAVTLNVDAVDPDGQTLIYKWTTTCAGTFVDDTQQNASFKLSQLPDSGQCEFKVDVEDPVGAHTIGILTQKTGKVTVDQAPVIEEATQSQDELGAGQSAVLTVKASDPDGQELTFSWAADAGTVTKTSGDAHSVVLNFDAPTTLPEVAMHVVVTVKDTGGQSGTVTFIFNRPNHAPTITGPTITPVPLLVGRQVRLDVVATDSDEDFLTYAWTATCDGTFDDATSAHPAFTLTSFPSGFYCSFEVVVADGHGGEAIGTVVTMADHLPVLEAPTISQAEIIVGEPVSLKVTASDPDGDVLSYSWSRSCDGSFDDKTAQNPSFTLAAMPDSGHCSFTVTVTDMRGGQSMATVEGPAGHAPDITDMQAIPLPLLVGQPTQLSVAATDAEGDPLTYAWETDCDGTFTGATSAAPSFTLITVPSSKLCIFQVLVSDGRGGVSLGQTTGQAGPIVIDVAPIIDVTSQTASVVGPGDTVLLSVSAWDPEGQPVSYVWTAVDGTLSPPVTEPDTSRSSVSWTAPAVLSATPMQVTVVVSDPNGLATHYTFEFTAAPQ